MELKLVYLEYLLSLLQSTVFAIPWECNGKVFMQKYAELNCVTLCHQDASEFP